jgi:hypothetical protein
MAILQHQRSPGGGGGVIAAVVGREKANAEFIFPP